SRLRLDLAGTHSDLGGWLRSLGRPREAEAQLRDALTLYRRALKDPPHERQARQGGARYALAAALNKLGGLLEATDRQRDAEAAYRAALTWGEQLAAEFPSRPLYWEVLAGVQNNLSNLLGAANRPQEAEAVFRDAVAVHKRLAATYPL